MEAEVETKRIEVTGLPKGWVWRGLNEVADNLDNKRKPINATEREGRRGDVPYYGATGQVGWIDTHLLNEELVLVGEDGAPFLEFGRPKAYMISGKSWVNNHAHVLRAKDGMPNAYLMHYLNILDYSPLVTGTTRLKLTKGAMSKILVPVAPLPEQRRIVGAIERHLGRLDAAVARLHAAKAKLKRYKQAVLKAAVEGRLTAVWREEHPNAFPADVGLSKHIAERRTKWEREKLKEFGKQPRNDAWKLKYKEPPVIATDNLPELPEGWTWVGLEQVAQGGQHALKAGPFGSALKKEFYVAKGYKIYGQEQVISGDPLYGDYYIDAARYESLKACAVKPGDLLISLVGTVGCVLILPDDIEPGIINPRLVKISVDANVMLPEYLKAYLESPYARQLFSLSTHGGTMEILNLSILKALPIPLPPIQEQRELLRIMDEASSSDGELDSTLDAQLLQATRLRQAVLKRAFEGRLK